MCSRINYKQQIYIQLHLEYVQPHKLQATDLYSKFNHKIKIENSRVETCKGTNSKNYETFS